MLHQLIASHLSVEPQPARLVLLFFAYSFIGYLVECVVLTVDKRELVLNRGFCRHLPFCIIYGFGAITGYALLKPLAGNWALLFIAGAAGATLFEFLVARLQILLFGDFWWDYTEKPFNYKGVICLESTIGWGAGALLVILLVHRQLAALINAVPQYAAGPLAAVLLIAYVLDFIISVRTAFSQKHSQDGALAEEAMRE